METSGERLDLERKRKELELRVEELEQSSSAHDDDYEALSREAERVTRELVKTKLDLAELSEKHVIIRHELYKAREGLAQCQAQATESVAVASDRHRRRR